MLAWVAEVLRVLNSLPFRKCNLESLYSPPGSAAHTAALAHTSKKCALCFTLATVVYAAAFPSTPDVALAM